MITTELDINLVTQAARYIFRADVAPERVKSGWSTYVYRVAHGGQSYYLRVLPEDASFAAEAKAHEILLAHGVTVPKPLYFEHKNELLGKSVMLTSEIPGRCLKKSVPKVLFEAGRQLALINSIPVEGFDWIDRSNYDHLTGVKQSFKSYYYDDHYYYGALYEVIEATREYGFDADRIKAAMDAAFPSLDTEQAWLSHGDFDNTHIFHRRERYTGIIDFCGVQGSHRLRDLGHYRLHDDHGGFRHLLRGYQELHPLTEEDMVKIECLALFVGIGRARNGSKHYRRLVIRQLGRMGLPAPTA